MNEVGQTKHYTTHERIHFLQITALPPSGVLQLFCSVGSLLQLDFLAASDTPVYVGCSPTNWQQEIARLLWTRMVQTVHPPVLSVLLQPHIEYAGDHSSSCSHSVTLEHQQLQPRPSFQRRMLQAWQARGYYSFYLQRQRCRLHAWQSFCRHCRRRRYRASCAAIGGDAGSDDVAHRHSTESLKFVFMRTGRHLKKLRCAC